MDMPRWSPYAGGGLGIVLAVNGFLGVGWPWTIIGGVMLFFASLALFEQRSRNGQPPDQP